MKTSPKKCGTPQNFITAHYACPAIMIVHNSSNCLLCLVYNKLMDPINLQMYDVIQMQNVKLLCCRIQIMYLMLMKII